MDLERGKVVQMMLLGKLCYLVFKAFIKAFTVIQLNQAGAKICETQFKLELAIRLEIQLAK
jgi:hypothetical protein